MIIYKCDICKKEVDHIESMVLYKTTLDYCVKCQQKVSKIQRAMKQSIKYYSDKKDKQLIEAEQNILNKYK